MYKALSETFWWDAKPQDSIENLDKLTPPKIAIHSRMLRPCGKSTGL